MKTTKSKSSRGGANTNGSSKQNGSSQRGSTRQSNASMLDSESHEGLLHLLEEELKDIYWAEKALTKALPKMIKNATSSQLVSSIEAHLAETEEHVTRLEEVFAMLGKTARGKKCEAMAGLIEEAESITKEQDGGAVLDAGIILAAQKVEHYEIATYGTLCAFAKVMGLQDVGSLLHQTLEEEKQADLTLTDLAESFINEEATSE